MPSSFTCPHCHGTTFCGGFERYGTLLTSEACSSCLVKSGLPVKGKYYKVVCSVCGGTGSVTEKAPSRDPAQSSLAWLLLASPLLLMAGFVTTMSIQQWRERQADYERMPEIVGQRAQEITKETPMADLKRQVLGASKQYLTVQLGEPDNTQKVPSPDGGVIELWSYTRWDGRLKVKVQDGVVTDASSQ